MMNEIMKQAKELVKHNKIKKISETMWEIEDNLIKLHTKKGRNLLTCSCYNDTIFCNESPFCKHKLAMIILELSFYKKLNKLIEEYSGYVKIKVPLSTESMLNDLKNLKK